MGAEAKPNIVIIGHGMGSWRSTQTALQKVGAEVVRAADPSIIAGADALVLPGVGAFPTAMQRLTHRGLIEPLNEFRASGKPILSICLGMQLLFEASSEHCEDSDPTEGLGWVEGYVEKWPTKDKHLNIGWTPVRWAEVSKLGKGLDSSQVAFYHLHGYVCRPADAQVATAITWIDPWYVSAVEQDNLYGVQFHPESSSVYPGLHLLKNFVDLCRNGEG